jgi:hypothetical protein
MGGTPRACFAYPQRLRRKVFAHYPLPARIISLAFTVTNFSIKKSWKNSGFPLTSIIPGSSFVVVIMTAVDSKADYPHLNR